MTLKLMTDHEVSQFGFDIKDQLDTIHIRHVNYKYSYSYDYTTDCHFTGLEYSDDNYLERLGDINVTTSVDGTLTEAIATLKVKFSILHKEPDETLVHPLSLIAYFSDKDQSAHYGDYFILYRGYVDEDQSKKCVLAYNRTRDHFYLYHDEHNITDIQAYQVEFTDDDPKPKDSELWSSKDGSVPLRFKIKNSKLYSTSIKKRIKDIHLLYDHLSSHYFNFRIYGDPIGTTIPEKDISITYEINGDKSVQTADKDCISAGPGSLSNNMNYYFKEIEFDIGKKEWTNNSITIGMKIEAFAEGVQYDEKGEMVHSDNKRTVCCKTKEPFAITITRRYDSPDYILKIVSDSSNSTQYMEWGVYRERLNTLFAPKLIQYAQKGIDSILSLKAQQINEPMLGKGAFVKLIFPIVDKENLPHFAIYIKDEQIELDAQHKYGYPVWDGVLSSNTKISPSVFVPHLTYSNKTGPHKYILHIMQHSGPDLPHIGSFTITMSESEVYSIDPDHITFTPSPGKSSSIEAKLVSVQPMMDFSGANALYFWELFYYTPMLMAQRLYQEHNFDQADRWLRYIWNPSGYIVDDHLEKRCWNVRPLLEEQSWRDTPLDTYDPDAACQYDPMHYKLAVFMRSLDLLIARGDAAYRKMEWDTLNEAKMWYAQAAHFLGEYPTTAQTTDWTSPSLSRAATNSNPQLFQRILSLLRMKRASHEQVLSATSLIHVFYPQMNECMLDYWHTIEQRMYNLRHNLSIDGQPLHLPIYAAPADPRALLSASVLADQGGADFEGELDYIPLWRFTVMLERARSMVAQLTQFGSILLSIIERQDAEALSQLLQNQAKTLGLASIVLQNKTIEDLDKEKLVIEAQRKGAVQRRQAYAALYDENISSDETRAMSLRADASRNSNISKGCITSGAIANTAAFIAGLADGPLHPGDALVAGGELFGIQADLLVTEAEKITLSESYRRRRQEWEIQRNMADAEVRQLDAQLSTHDVQRQAAVLQKRYLETQYAHTQFQLEYLQRKFTAKNLYSWLRGRLSGIYYQFYDLTISSCLAAQKTYFWETNSTQASFLHLNAWEDNRSGLMCGEILTADLARMEAAYHEWESRALEVERTVSLAQIYNNLPSNKFDLAKAIQEFLPDNGKKSEEKGNDKNVSDAKELNEIGSSNNTLVLESLTSQDYESDILRATVDLSALNLKHEYPTHGKAKRRIKQISVSLPALLGPYQDVQAELSYAHGDKLAKGCSAIAISRGMNDSGQFLLDFNDGRHLPFEGVDVDKDCVFTLSFFNATGTQKALLRTVSDIILHVRYTIREQETAA